MNVYYKCKEVNNLLCNEKLENQSEYYRFGWEFFGPFLYGYTKWLHAKIKQDKIEKVFFLARDGYMMKKAFDSLADKEIHAKYVYFSRKSIRQSLLWNCNTYEDSLKYLTKERFISLGKLLEYYGFSETERNNFANENGWSLCKEYEFNKLSTYEELNNLYKLFKNTINIRSYEQDKLIYRYLQQIDMLGECAIVDIGWHGSIQYYLEEYIARHSIKAVLKGYYVGILPNISLSGSTDGYLYDKKNSKMRKEILCFFGGYEKLFQSLEGSTSGYSERKNEIIPILNQFEYQGNEQIKSCIMDWQIAALCFVDKAVKSNIYYQNDYSLAMPLVNFGKNPSLENIKLFSFFYNNDGNKEFYTSQKKLYQYKPKELIHALSNSAWKTGFMKSVFKIPFPYYLIYSWLRK